MNINYEAIIEKAQQRSEKLQEFQKFAQDAGEQAEALVTSLRYFVKLSNTAILLDDEGREMLGVYNRIGTVGRLAGEMLDALTTKDRWGSDERCVWVLAEKLA